MLSTRRDLRAFGGGVVVFSSPSSPDVGDCDGDSLMLVDCVDDFVFCGANVEWFNDHGVGDLCWVVGG